MLHLRHHILIGLMTIVLAMVILASVLATSLNCDITVRAPFAISRRGEANPANLPDPGPLSVDTLRRGPGGPWYNGPYTYYCGIFNTGMPQQIRSGSLSLRVVNDTYAAPPQSCLRVYCYDTSAIYFCNDSPADTLAVPGYNIGWMADRLAMLCCDSHHGSSAQLFHPTEQWNTVVGYGNCRHDPDEPPSSFGTTNGGVNGDCIPNESRPSPGGSS
ncbi:hypothetical protein F503_05618 [Ophiostoma piceae UAMH 11346]|uniref:Uncharacterized protein n=1 Tax=Ophiostoma piceae (strain UAMH 11346) TaxID=1262450 RepID=S3CUX5_OPHP1|nr:hypothetical protein F503_05618 [Ophiostoma piceae UAMH 11346]